MVITATWYRVGAFSSQTSALNTFPIVLSTEGDRRFVFFLYHDIQWTQPSNDSNRYAQAGFNAGDGIAFEMLPHSRTQEINETKVKCHFDSSLQNIDGIIIDEFRAICLTPFASVHGPVSVEVSIDNGETFISAGTFTFAPLQYGSDEVIIETEDGDNLLSVEQCIKLKWHFSEMVRNTFPNDTKIDIELWKVSLNHQSQLQKDNTPIMLVQNLNLTKSIRIQLPSSISALSTCFIRVVAHFNAQIYAGLNTGLLIVRSHPSLAPELCQTWAVQQPEPSVWNNDSLLSCPMTRWQAIAAGRCCYQPDRQCYKGSTNQNNCWLHQARPGRDEPSAVECYVSITSNSHGAGAECCYDNNGTIITRGTGAGTDNRYQQTKFPVQHFFHDTVPYLQCCMMSTYTEACNKYMYYRPPRRGSNTMGSNGQMWGDPHFGTLDGTSYIFNGYGEYTYLAINNNTSPSNAFNASNQTYIFMSQIRTIPISFSNVTVTKGFAARSNNIENQSVSITISRREHLVLRRGNEILEFEDNINTLFFPEMTISRLDGNNNSHFSLSWTIGVTIEINVIKMMSPSQQLVLNIVASVAGIFRGKTYGLLGTYDGIENNDLRKKNREFVPSFIDPIKNNNSLIRSNCKINATSSPSSWNPAQRACYYDSSMTNDIKFGQASLMAGNELLSIRMHQRNPPSFRSSLPLTMTLTHGAHVYLNVSATSEYPSHVVKLFELHRPEHSTFNYNTGIFQWTPIKGEHYLSVEALDEIYNLKSKHDITFYVKVIDDGITAAPGKGSNNQVNEVNFIILIIGLNVIFYR
ncbi:unnamed protein product [Rotaria sordida]|uniref:Uncharacterized protein n=1 Tax=Rotaria sordida TaxID=392033 RepID=A0A818WMT3_9BILA|nr:unnamed protein product [Rotaria sordida]